MVNHPTQICRILMDTLQALIDARISRLHPVQKVIIVDTTTPKSNPGASSGYFICALMKDTDSDIPTLTDLDQETIVMATQAKDLLVGGTRLGQTYLKQYDNTKAATHQPT